MTLRRVSFILRKIEKSVRFVKTCHQLSTRFHKLVKREHYELFKILLIDASKISTIFIFWKNVVFLKKIDVVIQLS